jgi:hypothetical protein
MRQATDREKLFQASGANAVPQMILAAASMNLGTVWVSCAKQRSRNREADLKCPNNCDGSGSCYRPRPQLAQSEARVRHRRFNAQRSLGPDETPPRRG